MKTVTFQYSWIYWGRSVLILSLEQLLQQALSSGTRRWIESTTCGETGRLCCCSLNSLLHLCLSVVSVHPVLKNSVQSVPWGSWGGAALSGYSGGNQPSAEDGRSWEKTAESPITGQKSGCCYRGGCWDPRKRAGGKQLWADWRW